MTFTKFCSSLRLHKWNSSTVNSQALPRLTSSTNIYSEALGAHFESITVKFIGKTFCTLRIEQLLTSLICYHFTFIFNVMITLYYDVNIIIPAPTRIHLDIKVMEYFRFRKVVIIYQTHLTVSLMSVKSLSVINSPLTNPSLSLPLPHQPVHQNHLLISN